VSEHTQPDRRSPGRRALRLTVLALLLGPAVLMLVFRFVPVPGTPLMLIRLAQGHGISRDWVPLERIAPSLPRMVVASEDNLFCRQPLGFDTEALRAQAVAWWAGERPRGASTLTMQLSKNMFLWPGRDPLRKVLEAWLTPQLALLWPRRRVIEVYLNVVEFGPGLYGAEAAARQLFGKPASALTAAEASQLAVVLPAPLERDAARPDAERRVRAAAVRQRAAGLGALLDCLD